MAGTRPLTHREERALVRHIRRTNPRDRALITCQLFSGFRISEILALTIGHVLHRGAIRDRIGLPPRLLKGGYGQTRWIPVCPELHRALVQYVSRRASHEPLSVDAPLFPSRKRSKEGNAKSLFRSGAEKLIKRHLLAIAEGDTQMLSTHTLRKTWARRLYEQSGHDILLVRDGLGHSNVAITQKYLSSNRDRLDELIVKGDWTRQSRRKIVDMVPVSPAAPLAPLRSAVELVRPKTRPIARPKADSGMTAWLPGFEEPTAA